MAQASPPIEALIGEISSSKFKVLRLLGAGGMGAVFEAEHLFTKRRGALKLLHSHFAQMPEVVERFTREASAAGRIQNPHIVETFDAGRLESGHPYMFMELLAGTSLDSHLKERGPLPFEEAIGLCAQAAAGLAAAHKSGIIHRDIKPANLFLVEGKGTLVKLLDFGISKFLIMDEVSQVTQEGAALGTPYYMPPEQVMGRTDIDEGVDIYALGVVLYESVTGTPPYVAETLPALSVRIYEGRYEPVSSLRADTPPGFDDVLARCLAVDRTKRYATAQDLLSDLLAMIGRHAESLAPTIMAGSPMPMLSAPPPYIPSQPPGGNPAGASARPGPVSAAASALVKEPSIAPPTRPPWLWLGVAGAVALAVGGYFAFGVGDQADTDVANTNASAPPSAWDPAGAASTSAPTVEAVNASEKVLGVTTPGDPNVATPPIAATASGAGTASLGESKQRNTAKSAASSGSQTAPKTGAGPGVRQPNPDGTTQSGLKRENPFE